MEENRTDKKELFKGIKTMVFALLSLFMGPILLSFAFSKPDDKLYLPLLIIGCAICAMAVFLMFKGIRTIMGSMFKKK
ncbi:DUF6095 family protein [Jejuia pallidilutea]|jgi:O-antigen/teichoic acid export membrane protein|uniref:Uncharacterized protein n=1 Tax=Jejuia pallidilutea TaxID=504487 RepID=A0A090VV64_9FLAO|nr:DUF6095 family protein [Jejuia pallidilutea]GAL68635.1 hypothetical protein JCM19301_3222 [Jejuia pallidilutea]GAL72322.1 hypothetical protein JCM19302_67 [Jejuia pallidilutea]GAL89283.1 hypothetical protein JCM19538_3363 [Jejuia pallidilutea]